MAESGFDTLSSFQANNLVIEPIQPVKAVSGGTFSVGSPEDKQVNNQKDILAYDIASQNVAETPNWNELALQYVNQMIPVRAASDEQMSILAQQLGLGKRVTFDETLQSITEQLGPMPKTAAVDKTLNFIVDSLNARTPYKGAAAWFDILAQATGKYIDRETAEKAANITHNLKMKEMAIQQMNDVNAAMLAKESEFFLKKMGIDNDYMQKYMSFTGDLALKQAQFDMDTLKNKQEAALDLFKNPNRLFQNMTIVNPDDTTNVVMTKKVWNNQKGIYEFMMPRTDQQGNTVFDIPVPPNSYLSPLEGPQTDAALAIKAPNFGQASELIGDFNTLGRAGDIVTNMLKIDEEALASGKSSRFGVEGAFDYLKGETQYTLRSLFNAINPGAGDMFVTEGSTLYEKDKARYPLPPGEDELLRTIEFQAPKEGFIEKGLTFLPGVSETKTVSRIASIDDFFRPTTYTSLGYDGDYARLKVQENLIVYALARALKPSGRLNVDDIQRASQLVNLQGFRSPEYVRAQLNEILRFIRTAQVDIFDAGQYGDKNIFDDPKYKTQVDKYRQAIGELPPTIEPAPNSNNTMDISPVQDPEDLTIDLEPEDLFGGNI